MAIASYGSPIGTVENILGYASTGLTWYSDQDNAYDLDSNGNLTYLSVGKDTVISVRNTILGQIPESNVDALVSFSQLQYDFERAGGVDPGGRIIIYNGENGINPNLRNDLIKILLYDW